MALPLENANDFRMLLPTRFSITIIIPYEYIRYMCERQRERFFLMFRVNEKTERMENNNKKHNKTEIYIEEKFIAICNEDVHAILLSLSHSLSLFFVGNLTESVKMMS